MLVGCQLPPQTCSSIRQFLSLLFLPIANNQSPPASRYPASKQHVPPKLPSINIHCIPHSTLRVPFHRPRLDTRFLFFRLSQPVSLFCPFLVSFLIAVSLVLFFASGPTSFISLVRLTFFLCVATTCQSQVVSTSTCFCFSRRFSRPNGLCADIKRQSRVRMADTHAANTLRPPLSEASNRINAAYPSHEGPRPKSRYEQSRVPNGHNAHRSHYGHPSGQTSSRIPVPNPQSPPVAHANGAPVMRPPRGSEETIRASHASHESSTSGRNKKAYKTHIGPWQLGKTLGKGSSARVRLCRHSMTNQLAAVKIVNRRMANLVHDSSLAALSKWDNSLPEQIEGEMRVPMAIEREVAILKLIEHPNIMKLYDIWENRSEV